MRVKARICPWPKQPSSGADEIARDRRPIVEDRGRARRSQARAPRRPRLRSTMEGAQKRRPADQHLRGNPYCDAGDRSRSPGQLTKADGNTSVSPRPERDVSPQNAMMLHGVVSDFLDARILEPEPPMGDLPCAVRRISSCTACLESRNRGDVEGRRKSRPPALKDAEL